MVSPSLSSPFWHVGLLRLLLLWVLVVTTSTSTSACVTCHPYGCPLVPRDITFDKASRTALQQLRQQYQQQQQQQLRYDDGESDASTSSPVTKVDLKLRLLLNELSASGNDLQTIWTLRGYKGGSLQSQINQDRALILSPFQLQLQRSRRKRRRDKDAANHDDKNDENGKISNIDRQPKGEEDFTLPLARIEAQLLGVFDGHGKLGEVVAEYTVTELPRRLAQKLEQLDVTATTSTSRKPKASGSMIDDKKVIRAIVKVFQDVNQTIPTKGVGGCTASVVLRIGTKIYLANAGDSISFVATYVERTGHVHVGYKTREDKPHLPDEYQRILQMGGQVSIPTKAELDEGDSSRVVFVDMTSGSTTGLAMSRSIGDWDATGVISEPLVQVIDIHKWVDETIAKNPISTNSNHNDGATVESTCSSNGDFPVTDMGDDDDDNDVVHIFAVSATDGLMDYLTPHEIAQAFAKAFYKNNQQPGQGSAAAASSPPQHPHTVAEDLILKASEGWHNEMEGQYRDDITLAALHLYSSSPSNAAIHPFQSGRERA